MVKSQYRLVPTVHTQELEATISSGLKQIWLHLMKESQLRAVILLIIVVEMVGTIPPMIAAQTLVVCVAYTRECHKCVDP